MSKKVEMTPNQVAELILDVQRKHSQRLYELEERFTEVETQNQLLRKENRILQQELRDMDDDLIKRFTNHDAWASQVDAWVIDSLEPLVALHTDEGIKYPNFDIEEWFEADPEDDTDE